MLCGSGGVIYGHSGFDDSSCALELTERAGGRGVHSVTQGTTLLVIGEEGWALEDDGRASLKLRQALQLVSEGAGIRIVAESDSAADAWSGRAS
ncbi:MAG UNVERIFIED_CONTAM: hypothetical protein LVR18_36635 [Planctomycetaceae bacterium]